MRSLAEGTLSTDEVRRIAEELAWARPLTPYPGWAFDCEWNDSALEIRLRRAIWEHARRHRIAEPITMDWYHGLRVRCYLGNDTSKQLYVGGCIDPNEFLLLDEILEPGMSFLDVGANEGLYSLFASRKVGDSGIVWAFEPSPREALRLGSNLGLNGCSNVECFSWALGDHRSRAELAVAGFGHEGQNTLAPSFAYEVERLESLPVEVHRLDDVSGLDRLDVLKIDVEGYEVKVLSGSSATLAEFHPVIIVEAQDRTLQAQGSSTGELMELLRSFGYTLHRFDPGTGRLGPIQGPDVGLNLVALPGRSP